MSESYADAVRLALAGRQGTGDKPSNLRELANAAGYSYEHVRKVVNEGAAVSRSLNARLAAALQLPEGPMWDLAQRERATRRFGSVIALEPKSGHPFPEVWARLNETDRERVLSFAKALLATDGMAR